MARNIKQPPQREHEGTSQGDHDAADDGDVHPEDLDERAEEARELDRNPMKHDEYQDDVEHEMEDLEKYQGPDA